MDSLIKQGSFCFFLGPFRYRIRQHLVAFRVRQDPWFRGAKLLFVPRILAGHYALHRLIFHWRQRGLKLQWQEPSPREQYVQNKGASDFLVDGEVENWRPDNSPFGFSGVRHVSWPGTRIDR